MTSNQANAEHCSDLSKVDDTALQVNEAVATTEAARNAVVVQKNDKYVRATKSALLRQGVMALAEKQGIETVDLKPGSNKPKFTRGMGHNLAALLEFLLLTKDGNATHCNQIWTQMVLVGKTQLQQSFDYAKALQLIEISTGSGKRGFNAAKTISLGKNATGSNLKRLLTEGERRYLREIGLASPTDHYFHDEHGESDSSASTTWTLINVSGHLRDTDGSGMVQRHQTERIAELEQQVTALNVELAELKAKTTERSATQAEDAIHVTAERPSNTPKSEGIHVTAERSDISNYLDTSLIHLLEVTNPLGIDALPKGLVAVPFVKASRAGSISNGSEQSQTRLIPDRSTPCSASLAYGIAPPRQAAEWSGVQSRQDETNCLLVDLMIPFRRSQTEAAINSVLESCAADEKPGLLNPQGPSLVSEKLKPVENHPERASAEGKAEIQPTAPLNASEELVDISDVDLGELFGPYLPFGSKIYIENTQFSAPSLATVATADQLIKYQITNKFIPVDHLVVVTIAGATKAVPSSLLSARE